MKKVLIKVFVLLLWLSAVFSSCQKQNTVGVKYIVSKASSVYELQYRNQDGSLLNVEVNPNSGEDVWEYNFIAEEGQVVYLSAKYFDINTIINIQILIDGMVFKQTEENGDSLKYIVVSGVVPIK